MQRDNQAIGRNTKELSLAKLTTKYSDLLMAWTEPSKDSMMRKNNYALQTVQGECDLSHESVLGSTLLAVYTGAEFTHVQQHFSLEQLL